MPHGHWCCSGPCQGIVPVSSNLQGADSLVSCRMGAPQPTEGTCRVQTANSSAWRWPRVPCELPRSRVVRWQSLIVPSVQRGHCATAPGRGSENNFSSFCLGTNCPRLFGPSHFDLACSQGTRKAKRKISHRELLEVCSSLCCCLLENGERSWGGEIKGFVRKLCPRSHGTVLL